MHDWGAHFVDQMFQLITFAVLVLGGFYFILLRPVLQQQRRQRREMAQLQPGDEVLLTSGLIGTIVDMQVDEAEQAVMTLDLGGVRVRAIPSAIVQRWGKRLDQPEPGQQLESGS